MLRPDPGLGHLQAGLRVSIPHEGFEVLRLTLVDLGGMLLNEVSIPHEGFEVLRPLKRGRYEQVATHRFQSLTRDSRCCDQKGDRVQMAVIEFVSIPHEGFEVLRLVAYTDPRFSSQYVSIPHEGFEVLRLKQFVEQWDRDILEVSIPHEGFEVLRRDWRSHRIRQSQVFQSLTRDSRCCDQGWKKRVTPKEAIVSIPHEGFEVLRR